MIEIYNEKIRDLLADAQTSAAASPPSPSTTNTTPKLQVRTDSNGRPEIRGVRRVVVRSADELHALIGVGQRGRSTAATALNECSSRSHALVMLTLRMTDRDSRATWTGEYAGDKGCRPAGSSSIQSCKILDSIRRHLGDARPPRFRSPLARRSRRLGACCALAGHRRATARSEAHKPKPRRARQRRARAPSQSGARALPQLPSHPHPRPFRRLKDAHDRSGDERRGERTRVAQLAQLRRENFQHYASSEILSCGGDCSRWQRRRATRQQRGRCVEATHLESKVYFVHNRNKNDHNCNRAGQKMQTFNSFNFDFAHSSLVFVMSIGMFAVKKRECRVYSFEQSEQSVDCLFCKH